MLPLKTKNPFYCFPGMGAQFFTTDGQGTHSSSLHIFPVTNASDLSSQSSHPTILTA
jgi:hypothetical protein